jgi:hypothetical protein
MLLLACCPVVRADAPTEIERGFQSMYNLQFDQAHQDFAIWERLHPDDPVGPVSQAAGYLFAEFDRLDILESQLFTNDKKFAARSKLPRILKSERNSTAQSAGAISLPTPCSSSIPTTAMRFLPGSCPWACARTMPL